MKRNNANIKEENPIYKTDYDVPRFSFKSAIIIFLSAVLSLFVVPFLMDKIFTNFRMPSIILISLITGFTVSFTTRFIDSDKKMGKGFYITGILVSIAIFAILFLVEYTGLLI